MKRENYTVGNWCSQWFQNNCHKWSSSTESGYRNLIARHIIPCIGDVDLTELDEQVVADFYKRLHDKGLNNRSIWCVHLLLRRCMDEAARDGVIPHNPVRHCAVPEYEEYHPARLRLGQVQLYLNAAEENGILPMIYIGLTSGLRQCELLTLSWADFHVPYRYIHQRGRLLILNSKASELLRNTEPTESPYVFLNPKTWRPYQLHEFYYLHKTLLKQATLPWIAFRNLQRQCMEARV